MINIPTLELGQGQCSDFILKYIGAIDDNYKDAALVERRFLKNAMEALRNGKEIEMKETKMIGCSIKTL